MQKKRGVKEQSVKRWLKKLEGTAYEMEDILDEWHYALVNHRIESQKEKVWCSFIPSPCSCLCFKKLGVRHTIGIKLRGVKAKLDEILNEKDQFKFVTSLPPSDVEPNPPRVQSTSSIDQAKVQSLDIHKNKNEIVTKLMMDDSGTELLSIVGMGGIGKTTLAQLVYNDTQVMDCFGLRIWICVSDPFNVAKIARGIVNSVGRETIPQDTDQLELVLQKLRDSISGKKFLLVLDDVWTEKYQDWEPLKINLDHGAAGSKILVTSRNEGVAKMMGSLDHQIYYPQRLSDEECWSLLRRISLPGRRDEECREFEGVGMKIAGKCKGLPLAASVLGSLLQFKDSLEAWENVFKSEIWELEKAEIDLFPHLLLSYNELSPTLKRCFSYCAVYPKDAYINVEILIEEWMAQGYLGSIRGNGGVEVKGRDYFNILAMRSLFQDIKRKSGGSESCKMHDIVHDFALFLRGDYNNRLQEGGAATTKRGCQFCSPFLVSRVHEYRSLVWDKESPPNVCDCLASVRALRFDWQSLSRHGLPQGMNKLIHLRRLGLSHNELSEEDLKIICRLYFLQTLLLSHCSLENIPIEIGNLVELRHLDLSHNEELKELPREIGNLVELRHLNLNCNKGLKELPREIGNLVGLRRLDLCQNEELKDLPREIGNLVEMRHLDLSCNKGLKELPREIGNLVELRHLYLSDNRELKELPDSVYRLVELRILNLYWCENLQVLPEGIHRLRNLQHLDIARTPASHCLPLGIGELSGLRTLGTDLYIRSGWNKLGLLKTLNPFTYRTLGTDFYGGSGCNKLGLLKKLNTLTGLLKLEINFTSSSSDFEELVKDAQEAELRSKDHIHTLDILFRNDEVEGSSSSLSSSSLWMDMMEALEPNLKKLNVLMIWRYMGSRLPEWISSPLSSLKDLSLLAFDELSSLPPLGRLPCLEDLTMSNMYGLKFVGREFLGIQSSSSSSSSSSSTKEEEGEEEEVVFPKLKRLYIYRFPGWSEWEDITAEEEECSNVSIMPCLEEMSIRSCESLKKLPHGLLRKASSSLRILNISDSPLLKSQYGDEDGPGWRSVSQFNPHLQLRLN